MTDSVERLPAVIERLTELTGEAVKLAEGNPAARRNLYMIQQHLEMLRIEICEPLEVIREGKESDDR